MEVEIWKDVLGYEGIYQVSNLGRVKNLNYRGTNKERVFKKGHTNGYEVVGLTKNKKTTSHLVHRIVFEAFNGKIPTGLTVDHIDSNKQNQKLENLQLLTNVENARKANIGENNYWFGKVGYWQGKTFSDEHRLKLSESKKKYYQKKKYGPDR